MVWCEYEMSLTAHVLEPRPLDGGIIWGDSRNARRQNFVRKYVTEKEYLGVISLCPFLSLSLSPPSLCPVAMREEGPFLHMLSVLRCSAQMHVVKHPRAKSSETVTVSQPFFL